MEQDRRKYQSSPGNIVPGEDGFNREIKSTMPSTNEHVMTQ